MKISTGKIQYTFMSHSQNLEQVIITKQFNIRVS